ncbi:DUF4126 domain-containing protein [Terriglobus sp.]|uniref:DUF4126 domain-containing protein n=1 Tax=Terriglobus sp. TaxID=1889013 RepID=UPI003B009C3A
MSFSPGNLAALIIAASFAAGLNTYATILTLGLLSHTGWVALPQGLEVLGHPWVIGVSAVLFLAEFVADKIPALDLVWNALHTFIRIPAAALLAYRAADHLSPPMQMLAVAAGAAIAMVSHGSKTAVRAAVTASPEPASNIALSSIEDVTAVGLTWLATRHPWFSAAIALTLLTASIAAVRWILHRVRRAVNRLRNRLGGRADGRPLLEATNLR